MGHVEVSDRGITISKSLGWTMFGGLLLAGFVAGVQLNSILEAQANLAEVMERRHEETQEYRRETDRRVRILETFRATDSSEIGALRRDLGEFRKDVRDLTNLLRNVERQLGGQGR